MQDLFLCEYHRARLHMRDLVECYNIKEDELEEEEDPKKVNINKLEGFREVKRPVLKDYLPEYLKPMKMMKVNIGTS